MQTPLVNLSELTLHLEKLRGKLTEFIAELDSEQTSLKKLNIQDLLDTLNRKNLIAEELESLLKETHTTYSLPTDLNSLKESLETINPPANQETLDLVDEIITLSNQAHDLNLTNGLTIQSLSKINNQFLSLINPDSQIDIYGSTGKSKQSSNKNPLGSA